MATIQLSDSFVSRMRQNGYADKTILLIADDGGGRYSLQGGACSIGTKFSLIILDQPDPDYDVTLENAAGLHLYTSDYDMLFFNPGLKMDFEGGAISISDNAHALDSSVGTANGADVLPLSSRASWSMAKHANASPSELTAVGSLFCCPATLQISVTTIKQSL